MGKFNNKLFALRTASIIKKRGYAVIPNLISKKLCIKLIKILEFNSKKYQKLFASPGNVKKSQLQNKSNERIVVNLHNKNLAFFKIFEHPAVLKVLDILLKEGSYNNNEPYYLNNISARTPIKGSPAQQLHIDGGLPGVNYFLRVNALWCLNDFSKQNGSTVVMPNSHKRKDYPNDNVKYKKLKNIYAKAGSVIIFGGNLWHRGSSKKNNLPRWGVILGYARWWIKPSFDFMQNTPIHIYNKLNDSRKKLLGFNIIPPKDEFTRVRRVSDFCEIPQNYKLPTK